MITIESVKTREQWKDFLDLPYQIYKNTPQWAAPFKVQIKEQLDVNKNPFFKHARMHPLVAYREGQVIARLVVAVDDNNNQFHDEKVAVFGFWETRDDLEVNRVLFEKAKEWAKQQGMNCFRGPINLSVNNEAGLLIEGFDLSPAIMMTYHLPYYQKILEKLNFFKVKDLLAYEVSKDNRFSDRLLMHAERMKKKSSIKFRPLEMKNFFHEVESVLNIYNNAWEKNWGFVPMTSEEIRLLAKELKMIIDPELALIAEVRGEIAGFLLALPDINQVMKNIRNGELFPFGLVRLLWGLKGPFRRKKINQCRVITVGVKKKFQEIGLGPLFYTEIFKNGPALGYYTGEASWILEDNKPMNKALQMMKAKITKKYRIYENKF